MKAILFLVMNFLFSLAAWSCPESLQRFRTEFAQGHSLCEIHERYQTALKKLREQKILEPERIGNILAPRFINYPHWLKERAKKTAHFIYDPAPTTWLKWEVGADLVEAKAQENFYQRKVEPLTLAWLTDLHTATLSGLTGVHGQLRTSSEAGLAVTHKTALSRDQVDSIKSNEYLGLLDKSQKLVEFNITDCFEDLGDDFQGRWRENRKNGMGFIGSEWPKTDSFFLGEFDIEKQCGYFEYAPLIEVVPQLDLWLSEINTSVSTWGTANPQTDPLLVASRAQRWFISIHPFEDGNGRVSRFIIDLLLKSIGLPAPTLKNMDEDLYFNERQWAQEIGKGLLRTTIAAENCAKDLTLPGCAVISHQPEGENP